MLGKTGPTRMMNATFLLRQAERRQAKLLHLWGIEHQQLACQYNGQQQRLTNNRPSRVVEEILA